MAHATPNARRPSVARDVTTVDGLAQLAFLIHGILERRAADHGLSITQTRLLGILRDRVPTMNELAKLLELDKSSVTGLVDRAERRGLVQRTPSTSDRRAIQVSLTDHARSLASAIATQFDAEVSQILSGLQPQQQKTLTKLVSNVLVAHADSRGIDLFATERTR